MTFVNERLSEEDREKYKTSTWTIDKDKNAFLISRRGGNPEIPDHFEFHYCGKSYQFSAKCSYKEVDRDTLDATWHIESIFLNSTIINNDNKEILENIEQALKEYGPDTKLRTVKYRNVYINFPKVKQQKQNHREV